MKRSSQAYEPLARLFALENYSLCVYLQGAAPWIDGNERRPLEAVARIAADQRRMARRIAQRVEQLAGNPPHGNFSERYTWLNDLGFDYVLRQLLDEQRRHIGRIENCVAELASDRESRSLAEEALGAARANLESLEELERDRPS